MLARLQTKALSLVETEPDIQTPREESAKLRDLEAQREALVARRAELHREWQLAITAMREGAAERRQRQAADVLAGRSSETHRRPPDVHADILVVDDAIEALRAPIYSETAASSRRICQTVKSKHDAMVKDMAEKLITLRQAFVDYLDFGKSLETKGIAWGSLRPMPLSFLGEPTDITSDASLWLREAVREGFIDREAVPHDVVRRHG